MRGEVRKRVAHALTGLKPSLHGLREVGPSDLSALGNPGQERFFRFIEESAEEKLQSGIVAFPDLCRGAQDVQKLVSFVA